MQSRFAGYRQELRRDRGVVDPTDHIHGLQGSMASIRRMAELAATDSHIASPASLALRSLGLNMRQMPLRQPHNPAQPELGA